MDGSRLQGTQPVLGVLEVGLDLQRSLEQRLGLFLPVQMQVAHRDVVQTDGAVESNQVEGLVFLCSQGELAQDDVQSPDFRDDVRVCLRVEVAAPDPLQALQQSGAIEWVQLLAQLHQRDAEGVEQVRIPVGEAQEGDDGLDNKAKRDSLMIIL